MKIVTAVEGKTNVLIKEMSFLTRYGEIIKLDLDQISDVRWTTKKIYSTYEKITMNGLSMDQYGYLLNQSKLVSVSIDEDSLCDHVKFTDIHIYDRRDKYEIYVISKEQFENILIECR